MSAYLTPEERDGLKKEIFSSLHCALPGIVESYDPEKQTVSVRIPVRGGTPFPLLTDVPVFMPVPFEVTPGEMALVMFADTETESLLAPTREESPRSLRRHSLSDGFAFVGWKFESKGEEVP